MKTVLIANRGEIACRIIETCRKLNLRSVAVCSASEEGAKHAQMADQAVVIGPAPARQSYLNAAAVLRAAQETGADAIHPGYGFLSESADFANQVEAAGLIWLGPCPETIATMGDKGQARLAAIAADVPVLPGSVPIRPGQPAELAVLAKEIGFPLLVKAVAGGGGIGMRRVDALVDLPDSVSKAQAHAERTFADGTVYLERFISRARHIEVQVFGDGAGGVAVFPERDCTMQRRFQKILEESPAPNLPEPVRLAMQDAATNLARAQKYRSAGTVEFVFDADQGDWYFLEMNTRVQVEHRVTEMVTGTDIVAMQMKLALGELGTLPAAYPLAAPCWAIEARICAEAPEKGFLPQPGLLSRLDFPVAGASLIVDCGVRAGDAVSPHYDSMIGKIVAKGPSREAALHRLAEALAQTKIEGVRTNVEFLRLLLRNRAFETGNAHTRYVDDNLNALVEQMQTPA
ncbi:MAG: biotin carboxylase N-terminal domain-containing protein [Pseudodonghicola sp.]|nr:biotin carboxylase N-terminal domain-containing protein [Pseudodonghicola sp.]